MTTTLALPLTAATVILPALLLRDPAATFLTNFATVVTHLWPHIAIAAVVLANVSVLAARGRL